jgi:hypothetical protein
MDPATLLGNPGLYMPKGPTVATLVVRGVRATTGEDGAV